MSLLTTSRRTILLLSFFVMLLGYFFSSSVLGDARSELLSWASVITSVAFGVGISRLLSNNMRVIRRETGVSRYVELYQVIVTILTCVLGILPPLAGHPYFTWTYLNVYLVCSIAYGSICAFMFVSAIYRAFRIRTLESVFIIVAGVTMLLANAPIGELIWSGFPVLGSWLVTVESSGVFRAFLISASIGAIGLTIRSLLGMESIGA